MVRRARLTSRVIDGFEVVVDAATSKRLAKIRQRGTSPELQVRALLRTFGLRPGHSVVRLPGRPDFANRTEKWAVFVHGCYWHSHLGCYRATVPTRNREFWLAKFAGNRLRDKRVAAELRRGGYRVVTIWECEVEDRPVKAARKLERLAADLHGSGRG